LGLIKGESLILAGHTHCGQVRVPIITKVFFGPDWHGVLGGKQRLDDDTEEYVTCGITPGGVRFNAPPEISVITIE
jgi:predicted MPP superfamily phosphohydrolase